MENAFHFYKRLVPFLGQAFGDSCEIALQDCEAGCITAIANGHISGRQTGAPLTDLARQIIADASWKTRDFIAAYEGRAQDGRLLRSSTFFIKEDDRLLGMLCINCDTSVFAQISALALTLGGLTLPGSPALSRTDGAELPARENFFDDIDFALTNAVQDLLGGAFPDKFSQQERIAIMRRLDEKGIFLIKGAVSRIAEKLLCSEASVYRYLSMIHRAP